MAVGTKLFFDMMHEQPPKVMLFGGACSHVTTPIAESSQYWDIWQLSYADMNPILSDRSAFPYFFRTVPSDSDFNPARIQLLRHYNWTRVGTLFQDASQGSSRYAHAHFKFSALLDKAGIDRETESFSSDPKPALTNLKQKDIRIIFGNFDEDMARKVFCSAVNQKMVGAKYVWIILGYYSENWWRKNDTSLTCTQGQLRRALEGILGTDVLTLSTSDERTVSKLSVEEYKTLYDASRGSYFSKFHGYAYDGVWVIAKAIDHIIKQNGGVFAIDHFRNESMRLVLNDTNFIGVTGKVMFNDGDRIGQIKIQQFQEGRMVKIGEYDASDNRINLTKGVPVYWQTGMPPRDRTRQERVLQRVNLTLYIILCIIAGLGIVIASLFLAVNFKFSKHRYIKMSSPNMNNMIIIGCLLSYVSVFLLGTDGGLVKDEHFTYMCAVRSWVLCVAFTLSFGAMFSKTWRVHVIFTNIKSNRRAIKDYKLLLMVAFLLLVDLIILGAWQVIDPTRRQTKELPSKVDPTTRDVEIIPVIEYCVSNYMNIWLGVIYAYKGLLLIFGCFLAWETRQVSIPALNDSKYIGMSVYNVVIMCVSGVPISFIIKDRQDAAYLIIALFIIFCTTITLCLVFVPKLIELKRDPKGEEKRMRATLRKSSRKDSMNNGNITVKLRHLMDENHRFKQTLEKKERKIRELLQLLADEEPQMDGYPIVAKHKKVLALQGSANSRILANRISTGTLCSDDDSVYSVSSSTGLWPSDRGGKAYVTTRQDSTDTTCTETIELGDIPGQRLPCSKQVSLAGEVIENEFPSLVAEEDEETDHNLPPPPTYSSIMAESGAQYDESRSCSPPCHETIYQNDLADEVSTKEDSCSTHAEHEDDSDAMTSLLA